MTRRIQPHVAELALLPRLVELHDGAGAYLPHGPTTGAVVWEVPSPTDRCAGSIWGSTWAGAGEDSYGARARLPGVAGTYVTDAVFDVGVNGYRWAGTWSLSAAAVRAWLGIELLFDAPAGTTVRFRLYDGTSAWWYDPILGWEIATGASEWNTQAELQAHFTTWPSTQRRLQVRARLSTTTATATPSFFGARVAYGCREIGDLDDAFLRTLLAALRSSVTATAIREWTTTATTTSVALNDGETAYDLLGVEAAYNLTADPAEASPLAGTYAAGTWTPTTPIAVGKRLRIEFSHRPDLVFWRHREAQALARLPVVIFEPTGAIARWPGQGQDLVRNLLATVPTALELQAPDRWEVEVAVRVVAEWWRDADQVAQRVRAWLGRSGYRRLVSPETARIVDVRLLDSPAPSPAVLAQGVHEQRMRLLVGCQAAGGEALVSIPLVAEGGCSFLVR